MYRKEQKQLGFDSFYTPFGGTIRKDNRWVRMSVMVPWNELEGDYQAEFSPDAGAPAKPFRLALGALIIKRLLNISDREVVDLIRENHYMQYFVGFESYRDEPPFDPSLMTRFRHRISEETVDRAVHALHVEACRSGRIPRSRHMKRSRVKPGRGPENPETSDSAGREPQLGPAVAEHQLELGES